MAGHPLGRADHARGCRAHHDLDSLMRGIADRFRQQIMGQLGRQAHRPEFRHHIIAVDKDDLLAVDIMGGEGHEADDLVAAVPDHRDSFRAPK